MKLFWLRRTLMDRDAQLDHIARSSPLAAIGLGERIDHQITQLVQQPELGRPGRVAGSRELVISRTPFIAVYRLIGPRIEVLRLLHGAQQWP